MKYGIRLISRYGIVGFVAETAFKGLKLCKSSESFEALEWG